MWKIAKGHMRLDEGGHNVSVTCLKAAAHKIGTLGVIPLDSWHTTTSGGLGEKEQRPVQWDEKTASFRCQDT